MDAHTHKSELRTIFQLDQLPSSDLGLQNIQGSTSPLRGAESAPGLLQAPAQAASSRFPLAFLGRCWCQDSLTRGSLHDPRVADAAFRAEALHPFPTTGAPATAERPEVPVSGGDFEGQRGEALGGDLRAR